MNTKRYNRLSLLCVSIAFVLVLVLIASMQHVSVLLNPQKTASFDAGTKISQSKDTKASTQSDRATPEGSWTEERFYAMNFAGGDGSKENPFLIDNAAQLARMNWLITHSPDKSDFATKYYKLDNTTEKNEDGTLKNSKEPIDMGLHFWNPVGEYLDGSTERSQEFGGHFDGNGRTISNLVIVNNANSSAAASRVGFFGKLSGNAVVTNTVFDNAIATLMILDSDDVIEKDLTMGIIAAETTNNSDVSILNNYIHGGIIHTPFIDGLTVFEESIKVGFAVGWQGTDNSKLTIDALDIRMSQISINNVIDMSGWDIEAPEFMNSIGGFVGEARKVDITDSSFDGIIGVESTRIDATMDNARFIFAIGGAVGLLDNPADSESTSNFKDLDISGGLYVDTFSHSRSSKASRANPAPWASDVRYIGGIVGTADLTSDGAINVDGANVSLVMDAPNADEVIGINNGENIDPDKETENPASRSARTFSQEEIQKERQALNTTKNQNDLREFWAKREQTNKSPVRVQSNNKASQKQTRSDAPDGQEVYIPAAVVAPGIIAGMVYVVAASVLQFTGFASMVSMWGISSLTMFGAVGFSLSIIVAAAVAIVLIVAIVILAILFAYWGATKPEWKSYLSIGAAFGSNGRSNITVNDVHTATTVISKIEIFADKQYDAKVTNSRNFLPVQSSIISQPKDVEIAELGQTAKFEVQATGSYIGEVDEQYSHLEYQWYYNVEDKNYDGIALEDGDNISGATTSELTVQVDYVGYRYYYCVVNNKTLAFEWPAPSTTGYAGSKNTLPPLPIVTKQPQDAETASGVPASFEVVGEVGVGKLYYQWFISKTGSSAKDNKDGMAILGATDKEFRAVQREAGEYYYYVALTNKMDDYTNATFSEVAKLTVQAKSNAPTITKQPNSSQVLQGSVASMSIEVDLESFNGKISYQWYRSYGANTIEGSEKLEGQTSQVLNIRDTTEVGKRFYFVEATNTVTDADGVETKASTLSELGQVDIIQAVAGIIQKIEFNFTKGEGVYEVGHKGTEIVAAVQTSNGDTLSYQWYSSKVASSEGGIAIANATNASLSFTEQKEGVYYYYVVVTIKNSSSEFAQNSVASQSVSVVVKNSKEMSVKMTKTESDGNIDLMADVNRTAKDGAIQFQWYRSLNKDGSDAQVIDKAWGSVLRVSALGTRAQVDSYYYFVTVDTTSANSHTAVKAKAQNIASIVNANSKKLSTVAIVTTIAVLMAVLVATLVVAMIVVSNKRKSSSYNSRNARY